jgi:hypothetical protein
MGSGILSLGSVGCGGKGRETASVSGCEGKSGKLGGRIKLSGRVGVSCIIGGGRKPTSIGGNGNSIGGGGKEGRSIIILKIIMQSAVHFGWLRG